MSEPFAGFGIARVAVALATTVLPRLNEARVVKFTHMSHEA